MSSHVRWVWLSAFFAFVLTGCLATSGTAPAPHFLGGTVVGLTGQLTLFANGAAVTLIAPGEFAFPEPLSTGTPYEVVVIERPKGQDCAVLNAKGVIGDADVTNILVLCSEQTLFRIGGKVNGLSGKLILRNGTDSVTLDADGEFSFPVLVPNGTAYAVGIEQDPINQSCTIAGAVGNVMGADITSVNVTCLVEDARLVSLVLSEGLLSPTFKSDVSIYLANVNLLVPTITLVPTASSADALITVNESVVASGMESPTIQLHLGTNIINVRVQAPSGAEREYAVIVSREEKLSTTYIKASNVGGADFFGTSVAISGDLVAIGAPGEDSSSTTINGDQSTNDRPGSGAVYVFSRDNNTWKQEAIIKASNSDVNDRFGASVALDGNTLVVGAPDEDSKATTVNGAQDDNLSNDSGAAYVFVRDAVGVWSQQAYIKASNNGLSDAFGSAVAISGDTLAIGAPAEDGGIAGVNVDETSNGQNDSGAVYVYVRSGTMWEKQAYIKASNPDATDKFGASIALYGDTLAVGATDEDTGNTGIDPVSNETATESGAVYVFSRTTEIWKEQAFIKATNAAMGDRFGAAVSLGENRLAVGAPGEDSGTPGLLGNQFDNNAADAGAVYVFVRTGDTWTQEVYIKASNPDISDNFGASLALSGAQLVVGAFGEDASGVGLNASQQSNSEGLAGAVYLFSRNDNGWAQVGYLKALNSDPLDEFGRNLALFQGTLVCGSHMEDGGYAGVNGNPYNEGAPESGAVFVYH